MSNQGKVDELLRLKEALKRNRREGSRMRRRLKQLEEELGLYLESKEQSGFKYRNLAIIKENKIKRAIKKKKEKETDSIRFLEQQGIKNPQKILDGILECRRGEPVEQIKLSYKKYKKKSI